MLFHVSVNQNHRTLRSHYVAVVMYMHVVVVVVVIPFQFQWVPFFTLHRYSDMEVNSFAG